MLDERATGTRDRLWVGPDHGISDRRLTPRSRPFAGALLLLGVSACSGKVTDSPGRGEADAAGQLDAGSDAEPIDGSGSGGSSGWCALQGPHTFCEDFGEGVPGKLASAVSPGAGLSVDPTDYASPPQSMLAATSPLPAMGERSSAWGYYEASTPGASFHLQADFEIGSDCFANGDYDDIVIARVDYEMDSYGIVFYVSGEPSANGLVLGAGTYETTGDADGGTNPVGPADYGYFSADRWVTLTLWGQLTAGSSEGGFSIAPTQPPIAVGGGLLGPASTPAHPPTVYVGADVQSNESLSGGCDVHIDNVLFDVAP